MNLYDPNSMPPIGQQGGIMGNNFNPMVGLSGDPSQVPGMPPTGTGAPTPGVPMANPPPLKQGQPGMTTPPLGMGPSMNPPGTPAPTPSATPLASPTAASAAPDASNLAAPTVNAPKTPSGSTPGKMDKENSSDDVGLAASGKNSLANDAMKIMSFM